jgi:sensor histidine kinase regulating citrate/malate metabolism
VIIGNTVDNAITACQRLPAEKQVIDLTLKQKNHILCYEISNEYVDAPTRKEGLHGYGLRNVRNCVNRNNGYMTVEKENGKFVVTIRLEA